MLDYGSGNLRSAERALRRVGADVTVTADRQPRWTPTGWSCPASARSRRAWPGLRGGRRRRGSSTGGSPAAGRCWASASACRCCSSAASSTASAPRAAASGRAPSSGSRPTCCRTWAGTPSRAPAGSTLFAGLDADTRFYFVHTYARAPVGAGGVRRPARAAGDLGAPRRGLRRRGRERRAVRPPSSTPRSPATPARRCCATGSRRLADARIVSRMPAAFGVRSVARTLARDASRCSPPSTSPTARPSASCRARPARETPTATRCDAALAWQRDGAEWIHLVDLDAAFGRGNNAELLAAVVGELDVKVELSGGIRDDASLDRGAGHRLRAGQPRHRRAGEPASGCATVIAAARRPDRRRAGRRGRHAPLAARGWTARRRRPVGDAGPAGPRRLRPVRRHRRQQGRHAAGPEPGPAARGRRRDRRAGRRLRRDRRAGRPASRWPSAAAAGASRARSSARRCTRAGSRCPRRWPRSRPWPPASRTRAAEMSVAVRVIPCLDVDAGRVVKGVNFQNLRDAGDPVEMAARLRRRGRGRADVPRHHRVVAAAGRRCSTSCAAPPSRCSSRSPSGAASARRTTSTRCCAPGADKVSVNTAAIARPELLREVGAPVRLAVHRAVGRRPHGAGGQPPTPSGLEVTTHGGRRGTGIDAVEWAARGAGARRGGDPAQLDGRRRHPRPASTSDDRAPCAPRSTCR